MFINVNFNRSSSKSKEIVSSIIRIIPDMEEEIFTRNDICETFCENSKNENARRLFEVNFPFKKVLAENSLQI